MINISLDQPDVVVIVSDMFNKAQVLKDLYSKVGYQSLESFKSSTNEEIKDKSDYKKNFVRLFRIRNQSFFFTLFFQKK